MWCLKFLYSVVISQYLFIYCSGEEHLLSLCERCCGHIEETFEGEHRRAKTGGVLTMHLLLFPNPWSIKTIPRFSRKELWFQQNGPWLPLWCRFLLWFSLFVWPSLLCLPVWTGSEVRGGSTTNGEIKIHCALQTGAMNFKAHHFHLPHTQKTMENN